MFGTIENPTGYQSQDGSGIFTLLNNIFNLAGVIAGIFFIIQLITAGYGYISSNGDPKKTEAAWAKITQSLIGLIIVATAFVIVSVVGSFLNINILEPTIEPVSWHKQNYG